MFYDIKRHALSKQNERQITMLKYTSCGIPNVINVKSPQESKEKE